MEDARNGEWRRQRIDGRHGNSFARPRSDRDRAQDGRARKGCASGFSPPAPVLSSPLALPGEGRTDAATP
jgi:hypothetical protein